MKTLLLIFLGWSLGLMRRTGDPFAAVFAAAEDKTLAAAVLKKLGQQYRQQPASKPDAENP